MATPVLLQDGNQALATICPELGGWATRYARRTKRYGLVDALHHDEAVVARYPDRMWAGNPILFPHVSYNVLNGHEGQHHLLGRDLESPQHGFARRLPWRVTRQSTAEVTMELRDSEESRPSYPFAFRHELTYRLAHGRLDWIQRIHNPGSTPLPFSTGFHPYFPVPILPGSDRNQCHVRLPAGQRFAPVGQMASFSHSPFPAQNLGVDTDVSGTWFLGDLTSSTVVLVDPSAQLEIALGFGANPAYRFLALWSRSAKEPFYCIEPWTALPNSFGRADGEVIHLQPGEEFQASFWLELRET